MKREINKWVVLMSLLLLPAFCLAVNTMTLKTDTYNDFKKGELKSTSLSSEGKLYTSPKIEKLFASGEDLVWSMVKDQEGNIYLGTGNEGKIFKINPKGEGEVFLDLPEMEIYALAIDKASNLYAGASPGGKIYKISPKKEKETFFETNEDYVWDLSFDPEGNLFAATGKDGKIFKIKGKNKGEVYYDTPAANVLSLSWDKDNRLIAATQNKAFIYRINDKDKAFVLYQPKHDEAKKVAVDPNGNIYAALNVAPPKARDVMAEIEKAMEEQAGPALPMKPPLPMPKPPIKVKPEVIKIEPQGFVQTIWTSPETPVHTILYSPHLGQLLVTAGEKGNIYAVKDSSEFSILFSVEEKSILSLLPLEGGQEMICGTSGKGATYNISFKEAGEGIYISGPLDAKTPVNWGKLHLFADMPEDANILISTRGGNAEEPDNTWNDWSKETEVENREVPIVAPIARYLQWKVKLGPGKENKSPVIDIVKLYYIPPNIAPVIQAIKFQKLVAEKKPGKPERKATPPSPVKPAGSGKPGASEIVERPPDSNPKQLKISWKAADPNNDKLLFDLYFKGEEETTWKEIEEDWENNSYTFATDVIPDGQYRIKVVAKDEPNNPIESALKSELVSEVFQVDNTSPVIEELKYKQEAKSKITVTAKIQDEATIISSAKYSLDAEDWQYLLPVDGMFDSKMEEFSFPIEEELELGEHTLSLMATDGEGNSAAKKIILLFK